MERSGKGKTNSHTPLFGDDLFLEGISQETKDIEREFDPELDMDPNFQPEVKFDVPPEQVEETKPANSELSRGDKQIAAYRDSFLEDLRKHAEMAPKYKSKVNYFGRLQRLSAVMQNLAKRVREHSVAFTLEQLEDLRKELMEEGYAAGPPIDLGIEAARRMVKDPGAESTPRRTDLDWQKLAAGEQAERERDERNES